MSTEKKTEKQEGQQLATIQERQHTVANLLDQYKSSIQQALPKHIDADRMIRVALTAMTKTPDLLYCTKHSLISAVMTSGQLGLMPDNILGECYLIPFNNTKKKCKEAQLIVGYRGLCALAMRSGQVKSVQARAVFSANIKLPDGRDGDLFEFELGLDEKLKHIPNGIKDNAHITHFYAIVKFNNGGHVMDVMTREQVEKIRDESKNYQKAQDKEATIWTKYFDEMGCKTVLRRLMKYVPLSPDLQRAVALDEAADTGKQNLGVDIMTDPATTPDMAEDIEAELVEEQKTDVEDKIVKAKEVTAEKVEKATSNLETMLKRKAAIPKIKK